MIKCHFQLSEFTPTNSKFKVQPRGVLDPKKITIINKFVTTSQYMNLFKLNILSWMSTYFKIRYFGFIN